MSDGAPQPVGSCASGPVQRVRWPGGASAPLVVASTTGDVGAGLGLLGVEPGRPLVSLVGGAASLAPAVGGLLGTVLADGLVPVAEAASGTVLTGGTDVGVCRALGQATAGRLRRATLLGVAPVDLVTWPGRAARDGRAPLEPHHTAFLLTSGHEWGAETPMRLRAADVLARDEPPVVVLAGGGAIARTELLGHLDRGHPVVVLEGTGRLADVVAAMVAGRDVGDDHELAAAIASAHATVVPLRDGAERLRRALLHLRGRQGGDG